MEITAMEGMDSAASVEAAAAMEPTSATAMGERSGRQRDTERERSSCGDIP
jgi:hypothetical protein